MRKLLLLLALLSASVPALAQAGGCVQAPTTNFAPTNVTVQSASPTLVAASRCRNAVTVVNGSAVTVYLYSTSADSSVLGGPLVAGASLTLQTTSAVWGLAASATAAVTAWETF